MFKIKHSFLALFVAVSHTASAQELTTCNKTSRVVMTKKQLKSFLQDIVNVKKARLADANEVENKVRLLESKFNYLNSKKNNQPIYSKPVYVQPKAQWQASNTPNPPVNSNRDLEVDRINRKLDIVLDRINSIDKAQEVRYVNIPQKQEIKYINKPEKQEARYINIPKKQEIKDVPKLPVDKPVNQLNYDKKFSDLENQISILTQKLNDVKQGNKNSILEELIDKYGNFKKQVFFANNSKKVTDNYRNYIFQVAKLLAKHKELSVILEGYASTVGSPKYNKQLSMNRVEEVQKILLNMGVPTHKILPAFKGEVLSESDDYSRRVDISIGIK